MFIKKIRSFTVPIILLAILFISILALANALIQRPSVQKYLIDKVSHAIGYDIQTGEIELNLWGGIGILVHNFNASSRYDRNNFSASWVRIILDARELVSGRIVPSSLHLFKPKIDLATKDESHLSVGSKGFGAEGLPLFWIQGIKSILIEQGQMNFTERSFYLEELFLDARQTSPFPLTLMIKSHGNIGFRRKKVPFDINGIILSPSVGEAPSSVDIILKTGKAPLNWISWPKSLPVKRGDFETNLKIEGNFEEQISVNGLIYAESLEFYLSKHDRHKDFFIPEITFDFQSIIKGKSISVQPLNIKTQNLSMDLVFLLNRENGDRPYIELSAKSDFMKLETFKNFFPFPLLPLWLEKVLFPILDNGDIKLDSLILEGNTSQFKNLRIPENRSTLQLGFECRNFEVSGNGIQEPFREVSACVTLKDGDFHVSGIDARFGNSLITDAELFIKGILTHSPSFEVLMNGSFDIQELISQDEMDMIPPGVSQRLDRFRGLKGSMECKTRIGYEREWKVPRILEGEFLFSDCSFHKQGLFFPLKFKEAEILIYETNHGIFNSAGLWGNTPFDLTGNFVIAESSFEIWNMEISADMDMNQVVPVISQWDEPRLKFIGPLPWHVSMMKQKDYWSCLGEIDLEDMAMESEELSIDPPRGDNRIVFNLDIKPNDRINLKELLWRLRDSSIELSGEYNLHKNKSSKFDIRSSGFSIEDMGIHIKENGIPIAGILKGDLEISLSERNAKDVNLSGQLNGKNLSISPGIFSLPISDGSFQLSFFGKQAAIENCSMNLGESTIHINGELNRWDSLKGDITIRSDFLDISNILPPKDRTAMKDNGKDQDGFIHDMDIDIDMFILHGLYRKLMFGQMTAEMNLRHNCLYIKDSKINLENGILTMNGHVLTGNEPELLFSGDIHLTEQPIDELLESLGFEELDLKGSLTMEAQLTMTGMEKKDLIPSLAGHARILINEGLFKKSRVFIKVLNFLSLQNIYKKRPRELEGEGFYFENINADIIIDQGILESENFVMRSPVFNAVAYGKMDITQKKFDFVLGAQPHGTIDYLVSKIPILGYIITGDKRSILVYPFEVKGPVSNPEVKFVPFESLQKGLGGVLTRLLLTPKKILKDLNSATTSTEKKDLPGIDQ